MLHVFRDHQGSLCTGSGKRGRVEGNEIREGQEADHIESYRTKEALWI